MSQRLVHLAVVIAVIAMLTACGSANDQRHEDAPAISGRIEAGLRVLTFDPTAAGQHFTIYRGDYVRPEVPGERAFTLEIPALEVSFTAPVPEGERPYFKVPESGRFDFTLGDASGTIEAVDYVARGYRELTARDAAGLVANLRPFVLDVRTEREFAEGHLEGATLIPIQVLQKRINELDPVPRDRPVLVYCRSGNRSTVAAKMLLDAGFEQVYNIRRGIREWNSEGLPTVR